MAGGRFQFPRQIFRLLMPQIGNDYIKASFRQATTGRRTQAASTARDDDDFVF